MGVQLVMFSQIFPFGANIPPSYELHDLCVLYFSYFGFPVSSLTNYSGRAGCLWSHMHLTVRPSNVLYTPLLFCVTLRMAVLVNERFGFMLIVRRARHHCAGNTVRVIELLFVDF